MNRSILLAVLLGLTAVPSALAQSGPPVRQPDDEGAAVIRARLAEVGRPFPVAVSPSAPVTVSAAEPEDPEAVLARRLARRDEVPAGPGDALAVGGDIRVRGLNTTVRVRGGTVGELRLWQGLDVASTTRLDPTTGWLVFVGSRATQAFRNGAPLTMGRFRVDKTAGRVVLDSVGVGGAGSFSFGTLDLTNDVLATPSNLTVTTAITATTGALAFTGAGTQTLQLPAAVSRLQNVYLEKPSGAFRLMQALSITGTLRNSGTARLAGAVTIDTTGTLDLAAGTLRLGADLPVYGVLGANGGTFDPDGHTLSLLPTLSPTGRVRRVAAVGGDGSTLGAASPLARPYRDGEGWRMIAAPFAAQPFATLTDDFHTQGGPGADAPFGVTNLYTWDPTQPAGQRFVGVTDFTQPFDPGRGYFFYAYATDPGTGNAELPTTWDVTGVEPADTVQVLLSYSQTEAERRWNLLGNPFAAPLDWHDLQAFGRFRAAYATWDPAANGGLGNYAFYTTAGVSTGRAGRNVPAFQGFWTESTVLTPFGVLYDRAWKAPYDAPVYAGRSEGVPLQLRFHLQGAGLEATEPVALFLEGGAAGGDPYDTSWLTPLSADYAALFFVQDSATARLIFEGRPLDSEGGLLQLGVATTRAGTYTLTWPSLELAPSWPLVLEDRGTGAQVDLRGQTAYTFTLAPSAAPGDPHLLRAPDATGAGFGATPPRFVVHLGSVTTGVEAGAGPAALTLDAPRPNPARGAVRVRYGLPAAGTARVVLYDVLGRQVSVLHDAAQAAGWHEAAVDASALAAGVYVLRLEAGREVRTQRLTVGR